MMYVSKASDLEYSTGFKYIENINATAPQPQRTVLKYFAILKNVAHSLKPGETPSTPGSRLCAMFLNIENYLKMLRCGCGAVAFIFSIYLKPVLYDWGPTPYYYHMFVDDDFMGILKESFFKEGNFAFVGKHFSA